MTLRRPSRSVDVIMPTDDGKKQGQRARSLSTSTWSAALRGRIFTRRLPTSSSASNEAVAADG
jgi:hypothetical protein